MIEEYRLMFMISGLITIALMFVSVSDWAHQNQRGYSTLCAFAIISTIVSGSFYVFRWSP